MPRCLLFLLRIISHPNILLQVYYKIILSGFVVGILNLSIPFIVFIQKPYRIRRGGYPHPPAVRKNKRCGFFACAQNDTLVVKQPFSERHAGRSLRRKGRLIIFGMSWAPSPTNSDVGENSIRHINVKYRQPTSAIYRNHETIFCNYP